MPWISMQYREAAASAGMVGLLSNFIVYLILPVEDWIVTRRGFSG